MPQQYKSTLSIKEKDLLSEIQKAYNLSGPFTNITNLIVWEDRIIMAFSADGQRYFLKQWSQYVDSEKESTFILTTQIQAKKRGVPLPHIFETQHSERILNWRNNKYSLYEFVGTAYDPVHHTTQIQSCASTLGLLHSAMQDAPLEKHQWRDDPFGHAEYFIGITPEKAEKSHLSPKNKSHVTDLINKLSDLLIQAKEKSLSLGWQDLPQTPIHGDYCQFNCRFENNQVAGIVDWDHTRIGSRLIDIAHAINVGLGWDHTIDFYEDFQWQKAIQPNPDTITNWLTHYHRFGPPLTDIEIQIFPYICAAVWPSPSAAFVPNNDDEVAGCDAVLDYMHYHIENADKLSQELENL